MRKAMYPEPALEGFVEANLWCAAAIFGGPYSSCSGGVGGVSSAGKHGTENRAVN